MFETTNQICMSLPEKKTLPVLDHIQYGPEIYQAWGLALCHTNGWGVGGAKNVGFAVPFESSCSVDGASCMMVSLTCVVAYRYGAGARWEANSVILWQTNITMSNHHL